MHPLRPGRIVRAEVPDLNGHLKKRPVVIVTPVTDAEDEPIIYFAITGRFERPNAPREIFLHADPDGKLGTFVKKDCVVACWWKGEIRKSDILETYGELSPAQLRIMAHYFRSQRRDSPG